MKNFFKYDGDFNIPGLFSLGHLFLFIFTIILGISFIIFTRKKSKQFYYRVTLILAIFITILEIIKIGFYHYYKVFSMNHWLPLSYCALYIYAIWLATIKNKFISKIGITFMKTGAMIAGISYLIYPSTSITYWPTIHYLSFQPFIYHGIMFFVGIMYTINDNEKVKLTDIVYYLIFYVPLAFLAIFLNSTTDNNYMFLKDPFMLPEIVNKIYESSQFAYGLLVFLAYIFIFFVGYLINRLYWKIKKR